MPDELNLLENKKIAILGLGIENLALVRYLLKYKIECEITVCDKRDKKQLSEDNRRLLRSLALPRNDTKWQLGRDYNKNLDKFDVLFRSPGWPIKKVKSKKLKVKSYFSSPMRLFFELCPSKNIIGVTGTKGKGTTASLIYEILRAAGKQVWLGGNIGVAPFAFIDKIKKNDWVVLELSSFQLQDMTVSPQIAVITNFYPEHLAPADPNNPNFHENLKDYRDAKFNIIKWQKSGDKAVLNYELRPACRPACRTGRTGRITNYELNAKGKIIYFKKSDLPSKLIGEHNKENVAAAVEVAKVAGVGPETIKTAVAGFKGLEHRLEFVREVKGVKYYNDSFATTPETAIIALKSFKEPAVILLGGADKGADFKRLAQEVKKRCKFVILLNGRATGRIKQELVKAGFLKDKIKLFNDINEAVKTASKISVRGDIVLLSTACASFGLFKNYKERGKLFKAAVKKLPVK